MNLVLAVNLKNIKIVAGVKMKVIIGIIGALFLMVWLFIQQAWFFCILKKNKLYLLIKKSLGIQEAQVFPKWFKIVAYVFHPIVFLRKWREKYV